jgi:Lanthionine synthetase C-like protein
VQRCGEDFGVSEMGPSGRLSVPLFRRRTPNLWLHGLMCAWCHGAVGIGAMRLDLWERNAEWEAPAQASASIQATRRFVATAGKALRDGTHAEVTLCHGLGGAAELLSLAYEVTSVEDHRRAARRVGDPCLQIFRARGGRLISASGAIWSGADVPRGLPAIRCVRHKDFAQSIGCWRASCQVLHFFTRNRPAPRRLVARQRRVNCRCG